MKRFLTAALAALLLFSLSACGSSPADETPEEPATQPQEPETPPEPTPEELAAQQVEELLSSLTLEEKVGQLFFVRVPEADAAADVSTYHLGGYILFGRDFQDSAGAWLTRDAFVETVASYQSAALEDTGIPLLIGSDEEGGTVTRASRNPNLFDARFSSPQEIAAQATAARQRLFRRTPGRKIPPCWPWASM